MRKFARVDANHSDVVSQLRAIGCSVHSTAAVGDGFPDIVALRAGKVYLFEVKDGSKKASARKLTEDEQKFHTEWQSPYIGVVESGQEAVEYVLRGKVAAWAMRQKLLAKV